MLMIAVSLTKKAKSDDIVNYLDIQSHIDRRGVYLPSLFACTFYDIRSIFSGGLSGFNSEFFFLLSLRLKDPVYTRRTEK